MNLSPLPFLSEKLLICPQKLLICPQKLLICLHLRFCRNRPPFLSVNTSAFVGQKLRFCR
nr:MAG TPA: hypothetical protein [Caudoviricetes sp.]